MIEMMKTLRKDVYDIVIEYMEWYADHRHELVKHAAVFDFRRIPLRTQPTSPK